MSKVAVVYWSSTGNTEAMAEAVCVGAKGAGLDCDLMTITEFSADKMDEYTSVAFGCPAMGAEELEETEFLPVYEACEAKLEGKRIGLFGSYGWGDGEWMRTWEDNCKNAGAIMVADAVICVESPDEDAVEQCKELGAALAEK